MGLVSYFLIFIALLGTLYIFYVFFRFKEFVEEKKEWKELPKSLRISLWLGERYKPLLIITFVVQLISVAVSSYFVISKEEQFDRLSKAYHNLSQKVLVLYPNLQVAEIYLSNLKPKVLETYLNDITLNYLVWGKVCLMDLQTGGYATSVPEIPKYCKPVDRFLKSDLLTKEGLNYYAKALMGVFTLAKAGQLPEYIRPSNVSAIVKMQMKGNTLYFQYTANVNCEIQYLYGGKLNYGRGIYTVQMQGFINPEYSTLKNPFGVRITYVYLSPPPKPI